MEAVENFVCVLASGRIVCRDIPSALSSAHSFAHGCYSERAVCILAQRGLKVQWILSACVGQKRVLQRKRLPLTAMDVDCFLSR